MKNMKISAKLITSFLIMVVLANVVGGVGIIAMGQISNADTELYEKIWLPCKHWGISNTTSPLCVYITAMR